MADPPRTWLGFEKKSERRGPSGKRPRPVSRLAPDATVVFASERKAAGVDDVMAALDHDLVGLAPVKERIQEIAAHLLVDSVRIRFGLNAPRPSLHMCFTGPPGTGKTTVGLRMAELLHRLGYLENGTLVHAMRDDLIGPYVGQTAHQTRRVLNNAMGGVLFIDEAYNLYRPESGKDYGPEAIEILLQVMENDRDEIVVILAGYKDRMDEFFQSNPGMRSRVAHHLDFPEYHIDELEAIGKLMLSSSGYYLTDRARHELRDYLSRRRRDPNFANARSVRNALDQARLRHANRLLSDPERAWTRDDLMRIERDDLPTDDPLGTSEAGAAAAGPHRPAVPGATAS